jgi:hypothetical protein
MSNTTTYTILRQPQDVSVVDAAATTLLSYFLLRVIQWFLTSSFFVIFGKVILVFAVSGIVAILCTSSPLPKKGLNGEHRNTSKKHV